MKTELAQISSSNDVSRFRRELRHLGIRRLLSSRLLVHMRRQQSSASKSRFSAAANAAARPLFILFEEHLSADRAARRERGLRLLFFFLAPFWVRMGPRHVTHLRGAPSAFE